MFSKSADFYDEIYASVGKDYPREAERTHKIIQSHKLSNGNSLLDVACGTGTHAYLFSQHYRVEGLDVDKKMLTIARRKYPAIRFHHGDMKDFELRRKFDVVTCLFSSIGYVKTKTNLQKAVKTMSHHLVRGGVLLIAPWYTPEQWIPGYVSATQVTEPGLKILRISHHSRKGNVSILEFQYLVGTSKGITHSIERHQLGLFSENDYLAAFRAAGIKAVYDSKGLDGRGLYIGTKP